MIGFGEIFLPLLASFILPAVIGILLITIAARAIDVRYLAAFTIGIYLWFFTDTMGGANYLDVNEGFGGGIFQVAVWLLFAAGLVLLFAIDGDAFTRGPAGERFGFAIPILLALAIGIHGAAEGAAIGSSAATTTSTSILDAFGGLSASAAFLLHKGLEPMMVGAAYCVYAKGHAKDLAGRTRDVLLLSAVFALPGIVGGGVAYYLVQVYPGMDLTYVYALGLGTSVYAVIRLARPLFQAENTDRAYSTLLAIAALIGFTSIYLAALLHS